MTSADSVAETVRRAVSSVLRERNVIVVANVLAAATPVVPLLRQLGAREVLTVALSAGTGDLPDPAQSSFALPSSVPDIPDIHEEVRSWQAFVDEPPDDIRDAVDRFDPKHEAIVTVLIPVTLDRYLDRETYGGRPSGFTLLEDKTTNDALWAAAKVPHAPYLIVPTGDDLEAAAAGLDQGHGTVWAADARDGWNGGGGRVWWVRSPQDAAAATAVLRSCADLARILPFLEGIPCSIHGFVLPDGVAAFRPVELLVYRTASATFFFAGMSTWWDPSPADREQMRQVARQVGAHLAATHDYRGAFCVDGVLTRDGFRPTELNARFSGGLNVLAASWPEMPLRWAHDLAVRGVPVGITAEDLEVQVTDQVDEHRVGVANAAAPAAPAATPAAVDVTLPSGVPGTLEIGPAQRGAFVRFLPGGLDLGQRLAPAGRQAFERANELWHTGFPELFPAPDVPG